jgi:hypothetical protein
LATKQNEEHVIEDRVRQCLDDRDGAVADAAELRGVLSSLAAILVGYFRPENHKHNEEKSQPDPLPQV